MVSKVTPDNQLSCSSLAIFDENYPYGLTKNELLDRCIRATKGENVRSNSQPLHMRTGDVLENPILQEACTRLGLTNVRLDIPEPLVHATLPFAGSPDTIPEHNYLSLAVAIDAINFNQPHQIEDRGYGEGIFQKIDGVEMFYKIIGEVNTEHCMELAPNLSGICKQSYALWVGDWGGGSMGYKFRAGIYGLFELENGKEYIIPLKYFPRYFPNSSSRIAALDYLDSIK